MILGLRKQRQEDADSEAIAISRGKLIVSIDCSSILKEFSMVEMTEGRGGGGHVREERAEEIQGSENTRREMEMGREHGEWSSVE